MIRHRRASLFLFSFFCLCLLLAASGGFAVQHSSSPRKAPVRDFYLILSFTIYSGTDCDCIPITGVPINATGLDTDHIFSNVTDDYGRCTIQVEYDKTYRISIEEKNFESVLYDMQIIGNQTFVFHLKTLKGDINSLPTQGLPAFLTHLISLLQHTRQIAT